MIGDKSICQDYIVKFVISYYHSFSIAS